MKIEAVVCDLGKNGEQCPRLADHVCPLCHRDVCIEHRMPEIRVTIDVRWPQRAAPGQMPVDETANTDNAHVDICVVCYGELRHRTTPGIAGVAEKALAETIVVYGALLAERKLRSA